MTENTYEEFSAIVCHLDDGGVLELTLTNPRLNPVSPPMHAELARIWHVIEEDPEVRAVLVKGAGETFAAGGSFELIEECMSNPIASRKVLHQSRKLVEGMVSCSKPIVSAIRGAAFGAGLAVALLADISVAADDALLMDGHPRLGVAAGDHAALCWPLLCGMARAKYYLLLGERMSGEEAARIGLVSCSAPDSEVEARARRIVVALAEGPQEAIRGTKVSLNLWYSQAMPIFHASLGYEYLDFTAEDVKEGYSAYRAKREPKFDSVISD